MLADPGHTRELCDAVCKTDAHVLPETVQHDPVAFPHAISNQQADEAAKLGAWQHPQPTEDHLAGVLVAVVREGGRDADGEA